MHPTNPLPPPCKVPQSMSPSPPIPHSGIVASRAVALLAVLASGLASCAGPGKQELRVLSYNIHHGRGADGKIDLERIASVIRSTQPHLVALQEVDDRTGRSGGVDQAEVLGELTSMQAHFGRAIDYDGGQYGEALLLGLEASPPENHPLPASPGHEERAALAARVQLPGGGQALFVGTHLDHTKDPADRLSQAQTLARIFAKEQALILVGDLNTEVGSAPLKGLMALLQRAGGSRPLPTFPSHQPTRSIDHVLFRLPGWSVKSIRILEAPEASDHAPLLVVFEGTRQGP